MPSRLAGFVCLSVVMVTTACYGGMEHILYQRSFSYAKGSLLISEMSRHTDNN